MCGIAGYSVGVESRIDKTLAAQALFAAIAERGSHAAGYAYRRRDGLARVHKQRTGASRILDAVAIPADATDALFHVRDYTKGHPSLPANNHPIRHGSVVGVHNGVIANDEQLFERHAFERAEPGMSVDSEAIFALVERRPGVPSALEELYGTMATAWLDERSPETVFVARGLGRPLWLGEGRNETLFASTREALTLVERYARVRLAAVEVAEGSLVTLERGRVASVASFEPDRSFDEGERLPAVRAPEEARSCLERLAALAAGRGVATVPARAR
jgi:glucosamine 6-phosphate synthetase-like amidotransferase/phosphosugar isomerase protein